MTSKYADERLAALWDRVEALERAVEVAGAFCEEGVEGRYERIALGLALTTLKTSLVETFRGALLCSRDTTDASLDIWLQEIEAHEAERADQTTEASS